MKVNVDKSNDVKKSLHNMVNQNSTTFDFGFCEPLMVDELEPDSNITLRIGQVFRLNPMNSPTFGDIKLKTYINYVKSEDLYHPFPEMMSQQAYASVNGSYIPQQVPSISPFFIYSYIRMFSRINIYKITTYQSFTDWRKLITNPVVVTSTTEQASVMTEFYSNLDYSGLDTTSLISSYGAPVIDSDVTFEGADWVKVVQDNSTYYLVCGRYSQRAKNLYKIFVGCGFQFNESTKAKSLMPVFAYFKTWFDLFMPARTVTWTNTACFSFLEYVEQYALPIFNDWSSDSYSYARFLAFLDELCKCYYTMNVDFAAAHVDGQGNAIGMNASSSFDFMDPKSAVRSITVGGATNQAAGSYGAFSNNIPLGQRALDVLKAMDKRINTQSVLGGRISEILKSIYGSNYQEYESNLIGTQVLSANIDDVMSQAATDDAFLGQYAGKGLGSSSGKTFKFSASEGTKFGYLVVLAAVVPETRMSQGMDMQLNHLKRNDFFDKNFDALTLLPTEKNYIYGCQDIVQYGIDSEDYAAGFGNIPNYIEYKTKKNILNGDMAMRSTRSSYLPFTLDRLLPFGDFYKWPVGNSYDLITMDLDWIINGEKWRYIGKYNILGNYDRIFVNSGNEDRYDTQYQYDAYFNSYRMDDNFIVHNFLDYKKLSTGCEVADSWQTEAYGDHLSVQEA